MTLVIYKKLFFYMMIFFFLPQLFFLYIGFSSATLYHFLFIFVPLSLFLGTFIYLTYDKPFSFWLSFILVNLLWWPLFFKLALRAVFVIMHLGMDGADGMGSPLAFLIHLVYELVLFVPLSFIFITGSWLIFKNRSAVRQG